MDANGSVQTQLSPKKIIETANFTVRQGGSFQCLAAQNPALLEFISEPHLVYLMAQILQLIITSCLGSYGSFPSHLSPLLASNTPRFAPSIAPWRLRTRAPHIRSVASDSVVNFGQRFRRHDPHMLKDMKTYQEEMDGLELIE